MNWPVVARAMLETLLGFICLWSVLLGMVWLFKSFGWVAFVIAGSMPMSYMIGSTTFGKYIRRRWRAIFA